MVFAGNQTLGGTGQVLFGGTQNGDFLYVQSMSSLQATLTVGANITIHGGGPGNAVIQGLANNGKEFLINQGTINADLSGKTITVGTSLGGVTNQGALAATNGGNLTIVGPLTNSGTATLTEATSSTIRLSGSVTGNTTNIGLYKMSGTTILNGSGTSTNPQLLEVLSPDLGNLTTAFSGNAAYANLSLSGTDYVRLVDQSANSGTAGSEALYANSLIVPAGTTLDLNGLHAYVRAFQNGGTIINGTINQLPDAGQLTVNSPTPGQISSAGELDEWSFFGKAGQSQTIVLDPGSGTAGGPISPTLKWGEIQLLDPSGNVLATKDDTTSGGIITIDDITLPTDGTYKIRVRAATTQTASTGNYVIASWNVTSTLQALNLNQHVVGNLATPYTIDHRKFAAEPPARRSTSTSPPLRPTDSTYTLSGPGGFSGFLFQHHRQFVADQFARFRHLHPHRQWKQRRQRQVRLRNRSNQPHRTAPWHTLQRQLRRQRAGAALHRPRHRQQSPLPDSFRRLHHGPHRNLRPLRCAADPRNLRLRRQRLRRQPQHPRPQRQPRHLVRTRLRRIDQANPQRLYPQRLFLRSRPHRLNA